MRRLLRLVLAFLAVPLSTLGLVVVATPAHAADLYRYWSSFEVQGGGYVYAKKGVGDSTPADGSTVAFRYAASAETSPNLPRIDPASVTYGAVCSGRTAAAGDKLVAVLIDFGVKQDSDGQQIPSPEARCADVPTQATTLQVLERVGTARTKTSSFGVLLCAIGGYPATGCADQKTSTPTPKDSGFLTVAIPRGSSTGSPSGSSSASSSSSPTTSTSASANPTADQGTGQANDQNVEQGRGSSAWPYVIVVVVFFGLVIAALYFVRKRRSI